MSEDSVPQISSQEMENAGKKFHPVASASSAVAVILFLNYYFALQFNYFLFKTRYRTVTLRPQHFQYRFTQLLVHLRLSQ
jgi:hypothetical protein